MPTCQTGVLVEINEEISCDDSVQIVLKLAWIHRNVYDPGQIQKDLYGDKKGLNCLCPPPPPQAYQFALTRYFIGCIFHIVIPDYPS